MVVGAASMYMCVQVVQYNHDRERASSAPSCRDGHDNSPVPCRISGPARRHEHWNPLVGWWNAALQPRQTRWLAG